MICRDDGPLVIKYTVNLNTGSPVAAYAPNDYLFGAPAQKPPPKENMKPKFISLPSIGINRPN